LKKPAPLRGKVTRDGLKTGLLLRLHHATLQLSLSMCMNLHIRQT
jgi:hypothetical protein